MNMPMIKGVNDDNIRFLASLTNITLMFNDTDDIEDDCTDFTNIITQVAFNDGSACSQLMSCTNEIIDIYKLNCHSFEEFLVALDLHNCLFNVDIDELIQSNRKSMKSNKVTKLLKENVMLKKQLENIKKCLKTFN